MFMYLKLIYVEIIVQSLALAREYKNNRIKRNIIVGIRISFINIAIIDIEQRTHTHKYTRR